MNEINKEGEIENLTGIVFLSNKSRKQLLRMKPPI